jgi:hypothetical protein
MFSKTAVLLLAFAAAAIIAAAADAGAWKPGTPTLVSEQEAQQLMEKKFDHVFCTGVPRFGHSGDWPDATYRVLDCSVEQGDTICPGVRVAAVKAARRFYFRLNIMRQGECY